MSMVVEPLHPDICLEEVSGKDDSPYLIKSFDQVGLWHKLPVSYADDGRPRSPRQLKDEARSLLVVTLLFYQN